MRFRAINEERERLAREMHDTLIQGCVGVSTLIEAALGVDSEEGLRQELLNYATQQAQAMIETAREAVWDLRHRSELQATDAGLLCENLAAGFQEQSGVTIGCEVSGQRIVLVGSDAHELLMILREAVSNALTHGLPTRIDIRASFSRDEFRIDVVDNGSGFDVAEAFARKKHFGLIGMDERAKLLNGHIQIRSTPGLGTEVNIVVSYKGLTSARKSDASYSKHI
jgi:signal transduction histidine kinase